MPMYSTKRTYKNYYYFYVVAGSLVYLYHCNYNSKPDMWHGITVGLYICES